MTGNPIQVITHGTDENFVDEGEGYRMRNWRVTVRRLDITIEDMDKNKLGCWNMQMFPKFGPLCTTLPQTDADFAAVLNEFPNRPGVYEYQTKNGKVVVTGKVKDKR